MNPVTATHIHLVLCHFPVVIILSGLGGLAAGKWRGSRDIQKAALVMFVAGAILAVPLYLTGSLASGMVKGLPGVSEHILEQHQAAAGVTLAGSIVLGILSLGGLIYYRARAIANRFSLLLLAGALLAGGLMIWTAGLGGRIRHSEIRSSDAQSE